MDWTQVWMIVLFPAIGWVVAILAKRSTYKRGGDAYAANRIYRVVLLASLAFGISVFIYRAL